ncbi:unnamed protein product [Meganyctiphanes norvegica]|uniref:Fe2OG dioxygenase domain-containing protein n=1 Tax=Meganyctiphanes norvegica TaxID=48144 RepID=A0AAV2R262_MEGNR
MFLLNTLNLYKVMDPSLVLVCTVMAPMLLWPLQCSGVSSDESILDSQRLDIIQPEESSSIFEKNTQTSSIQYFKTDNSCHKNKTLVGIDSDEKCKIETPRPLFQFFKGILSPTESKELCEFVWNTGLGADPTSKNFLERNKNIRFIKVLEKGFETNDQSWYMQSEQYNDYSGGFKRYYDLIPEHLVMGPMYNVIASYIDYLKIPTNTIFMIQLQSSIIRATDNGDGDITGQGIHTDGCDDAMLVCIDRDNVQGAESQFHASLDGTQPLGDSTILEAGDGVIFRDNKLFHYVTKATTTEPVARRTMILIHSPFDGSGDLNPTNQYGTNDATVQLRYDSPFKNHDDSAI